MSDEGMSDAEFDAKVGFPVGERYVPRSKLDASEARALAAERERDRLYSLAKANNNLVRMMTTERKALREAASKAADQFGFYVTEHRAKGTPASYTKAETNERMRDMLLAALTANHSAPQEQQP